MLAVPALAAPIVLVGDYIKVGINDAGTLGSGGSVKPGIQYDGTGTGTFNDAYDYLTPGSPYEGFTVKGNNGTAFSYANNNTNPAAAQITGVLTNYSGVEYNGSTYDQRAVWEGGYTGLFTLTNDYYFNSNGQQLKIDTTITALTNLTDLMFGRYTDPDAVAAPGDSSITNNFLGNGDIPASDLVYAEALASKYVIGLYTNSPVRHGAGVTSPWSTDPSMYLDGTYAGPQGDDAIGLGFDIGTLADGESIKLQYQYIFGTDIQAAIEAGGGGTAPTSIGEGQSYTDDDLANGNVLPVFDGGTLAIGTASIIAGDMVINDGGGTIDTGANNAMLSGKLSGTGGLTKSGDGTLVLSGSNSYSGTTTISGGTLVAHTGSLPGDVENNASLIMEQPTDGVYSGTISGDGTFIKRGAGQLRLTGDNGYAGATRVDEGTLVVGKASLPGGVETNATFVMDLQSDQDGVMNGTEVRGVGTLRKTGQGTLQVGADNAISVASFHIDEGHAALNTTMNHTAVVVNGGGSVGGNGTVGGLIVRTDATASPGNSIGELTSATYVLFEKGSHYDVEVDAAGNHDKVVATDTATLEGGTVHVLAENGDYAPATSYEILTAGKGVTGTFDDVDSNLAFLEPVLSYTPNSVVLTMLRNDLTFADVAATPNQAAAGGAADEAFGFGDDVYMNLIGASAGEAQVAFDHLSGEVHASALGSVAQSASGLRRALLARSTRISTADRDRPVSLWVQGMGDWGNLDGDSNGNTAEVDNTTYGFLAGMEVELTETVRLGMVTGFSDTDVVVGARHSKASIDSNHAGVYGAYLNEGFSVRGGVTYSGLHFDTRRTVMVRGFAEELRARYEGDAWQVFGEAAYRVSQGRGHIEPYAGLAKVWVSKDAFSERGGSTALTDAGDNADFAWSTLGLRAATPAATNQPITLQGGVAWQHALGGRLTEASMSFAGGDMFTVHGAPLERDSLILDAGIEWRLTSRVAVGANYAGAISDRRTDQSVKFSLSLGL